MGARVRQFFDAAEQAGGMIGKMRLASMTRVTSTQAASIEDTPEVIARFEDALAKLQKEFGAKPVPVSSSHPQDRVPSSPKPNGDAQLLRRRLATVQELLTQRALFLGDAVETSRRVNESATSCLDVERVSVWLLDKDRTKIRCLDLFVRTSRNHSEGVELFAKDFGPYFAALQSERTIAANDAHTDPRTSCFSESYLRPLGIGAMLDVPIWANGRMVGVVCHEHVGGHRSWNADEEVFAASMGALVALALERQKS